MISMKSMSGLRPTIHQRPTRPSEGIFNAIDRLGRFPLIGHKGRARDTFEWVVTESSHVIVYSLDHTRDVLAVIGVFRFSQENRRP